jgi:hypothetical protein
MLRATDYSQPLSTSLRAGVGILLPSAPKTGKCCLGRVKIKDQRLKKKDKGKNTKKLETG